METREKSPMQATWRTTGCAWTPLNSSDSYRQEWTCDGCGEVWVVGPTEPVKTECACLNLKRLD